MLLHCHAGCTVDAVCAAVGIGVGERLPELRALGDVACQLLCRVAKAGWRFQGQRGALLVGFGWNDFPPPLQSMRQSFLLHDDPFYSVSIQVANRVGERRAGVKRG